MAHHAYVRTDESERGIAAATAYARDIRSIDPTDINELRFGLFSVEDARKLADMAYRAPQAGAEKAIIVSLTRIFHEAQNALLKLFEEPPAGTLLVLIVPSEGLLLPTLRSRLQKLPEGSESERPLSADLQAFLSASTEERAKLIAKLLDRTKSDTDEEKQAARRDAVNLVSGLTEAAYRAQVATGDPLRQDELRAFLADLNAFTPILHERSAPLKLIFEHLLLVIPKSLG